MTIWTYLYSGGPWDSFHHYGKYKPFPGIVPWQTAGIFRMFLADGVRGVFIERRHVLRAGRYVALKLAYNPTIDTDRLIDDYFSDYYGAAGPAVKEFYRRLEAPTGMKNYPGSTSGPRTT